MARTLLISNIMAAGLLVAGCGPLGVGLTAVSLLTGGGGDPNAVVPPPTPRADLMQALQFVDTGTTETCNAQMREILAAEEGDDAADLSCRVQPVCLGGSSQPVPMMVCPENTQQVEPATRRMPDHSDAWEWKSET